MLLITKLPRYNDVDYTDKELADLLIPFGFKYTQENIYIVPQREMVSTDLMFKSEHVDFCHNWQSTIVSFSLFLKCFLLLFLKLSHTLPFSQGFCRDARRGKCSWRNEGFQK